MTFDKAVEHILKSEGVYSFDSDDFGGETKYGISQKAYPNIRIHELTRDQAKAIYERDYWLKSGCDTLPAYLRLSVFDCAVNQGNQFAIRTLQRLLNVKIDGVIGIKTTTAAFNYTNDMDLLQKFLTERMMRYMQHPMFSKYSRGWIMRVMGVAIMSLG